MDPSLLRIACNDHLAAAVGLASVAHRSASATPAGDRRAALEATGALLDEQATVLRDLMARLGLRVDRLKLLGGRLGPALGRLKLNGRLVRRSPLSDLVELDALEAGLTFHGAVWTALAEVPEVVEVAGAGALADLRARVDEHAQRLAAFRPAVARAAFADRRT